MHHAKVALVTGANKGLGKEVARQLGALGMQVLLGARDLRLGQEAARELRGEGLNVQPLYLDVRDDDSVASAARWIGDGHGRLDVLVANAGILRRVPTLETTATDMQDTYATNVFGVVRTIHKMLPLLQASAGARIVTVASTSASQTLCSDPKSLFGRSDTILAYASSKAALTMLTVQYANAFRRSSAHAHIKINAATPGHIATDLNNHQGTRTVDQGAKIVVELATLDETGPSGGFFNDDGSLPW
ncbi:SDR family oxidoreductase [Rhizobium sp. RM]|uniref:SDR family oxidoreductase n=1 Tax=Rhizobium sp. RM TaxID=2748079 RepID=UPI00110E4090|nr:SDR family oxidoreductase [Rhizobium sp. RM]NWJ26052.1 SDR family oxidoreductase [Rhizobium sp. RM]TMV20659.1 SDR family oxidoreductase [Rhizobium sp. Td3]